MVDLLLIIKLMMRMGAYPTSGHGIKAKSLLLFRSTSFAAGKLQARFIGRFAK
jgi:hypothetical protein